MDVLNKDQVVEWMCRHLPRGTPIQPLTRLPQLGVVGYEVVDLPFPVDSGGKTVLARLLYTELFSAEAQLLVYLQTWNVFPSSGHVPLLLRFRQALGEVRTLDEYPGHLFTRDEGDDVISFMLMALMFFWDCLLVGQGGKAAFYVSHDEYCSFLAKDHGAIVTFQELYEMATQ